MDWPTRQCWNVETMKTSFFITNAGKHSHLSGLGYNLYYMQQLKKTAKMGVTLGCGSTGLSAPT